MMSGLKMILLWYKQGLTSFLLFRAVHGVPIKVLQGLLNVDYRTAKAAFFDMVMFDNLRVGGPPTMFDNNPNISKESCRHPANCLE